MQIFSIVRIKLRLGTADPTPAFTLCLRLPLFYNGFMNAPRPIPPAAPTVCSGPRPLRRLLVVVGLLLTGPAAAEWHGSLSFLSDYQYRGYSKSRSNPVVQGNLEYQHRLGWYAGTTLSQVSFDDKPIRDRAGFEARPYFGWTFQPLANWRADLFAMGYLYDGNLFSRPADYAEIYASATYRGWLTGRVSLAPDAYQLGHAIFNYELSGRHQLLDNVQLSAGLGYHHAGQLLHTEYFYWNAGATWYLTHYLALDMRYSDAQPAAPDEDQPFGPDEFYPRPIENKWLLSVTLGF